MSVSHSTIESLLNDTETDWWSFTFAMAHSLVGGAPACPLLPGIVITEFRLMRNKSIVFQLRIKSWQKQASSKYKSNSLGSFFKAYQEGKITGSSHPLILSQQLTPTPLAVRSMAVTSKCGPKVRVRKAWCGYLLRETSELMTSSSAWRLFSALADRHWLWGLACRKLISTQGNTVATCVLWLWKCACNKCIREVWEKHREPVLG